MKVAEAIDQYLAHQRFKGLEPGSIRTIGHALRTVFAPALDRKITALAADGEGEALRDSLSQRVSRASRKPLTPTTVEPYLNAGKAFLTWCVSQGWLKKNPLEPPHIGELLRNLRESAHLTRAELEVQTGVQMSALRAIEMARHRLSRPILDRLLTAPCLATLPARVAAAGLELPQDDDDVEGATKP